VADGARGRQVAVAALLVAITALADGPNASSVADDAWEVATSLMQLSSPTLSSP
jgi:hypothetical protein